MAALALQPSETVVPELGDGGRLLLFPVVSSTKRERIELSEAVAELVLLECGTSSWPASLSVNSLRDET
jgi:hypothetical protein